MHITRLDEHYDIGTAHGALSPEACASLIARAEGVGFDDAPVTTSTGFKMIPELRNNTRVMLDDLVLAASLWEQLAGLFPATRGAWRAVGLNERLRFYRYTPGQRFAWHRDGCFARDDHERSRLTLMLYLNGDFDGGATEFDLDEPLSVKPEAGMALWFAHHVRHQGAEVTRGVKYALRTDVMYRREA